MKLFYLLQNLDDEIEKVKKYSFQIKNLLTKSCKQINITIILLCFIIILFSSSHDDEEEEGHLWMWIWEDWCPEIEKISFSHIFPDAKV